MGVARSTRHSAVPLRAFRWSRLRRRRPAGVCLSLVARPLRFMSMTCVERIPVRVCADAPTGLRRLALREPPFDESAIRGIEYRLRRRACRRIVEWGDARATTSIRPDLRGSSRHRRDASAGDLWRTVSAAAVRRKTPPFTLDPMWVPTGCPRLVLPECNFKLAHVIRRVNHLCSLYDRIKSLIVLIGD